MAAQRTIPSEVIERIKELGYRVRLARTRRGMSIAELAAKAGINRNTLNALELGKPGIALGAYVTTLWALGLDKTLDGVAHPDADGPRQDARGLTPAGTRAQVAEAKERI